MKELLPIQVQRLAENFPYDEVFNCFMPFIALFGGAAIGFTLAESRGITLRNAAVFITGIVVAANSGTDITPAIFGGGMITGAVTRAFPLSSDPGSD